MARSSLARSTALLWNKSLTATTSWDGPRVGPRPASLPDYRQTYALGSADMSGRGGAGNTALAFKPYVGKRPANTLAATLQQAAPGAILTRVSRLIAGGKPKRQREIDAAALDHEVISIIAACRFEVTQRLSGQLPVVRSGIPSV